MKAKESIFVIDENNIVEKKKKLSGPSKSLPNTRRPEAGYMEDINILRWSIVIII